MKVTKAYCGFWGATPEFYTTESKTRRTSTDREQKVSLNTGKAETKESQLSVTKWASWCPSSALDRFIHPGTGNARSCSLPRLGALPEEQSRTPAPGALLPPPEETRCPGLVSQGCCNKGPQTTNNRNALSYTCRDRSQKSSPSRSAGESRLLPHPAFGDSRLVAARPTIGLHRAFSVSHQKSFLLFLLWGYMASNRGSTLNPGCSYLEILQGIHKTLLLSRSHL